MDISGINGPGGTPCSSRARTTFFFLNRVKYYTGLRFLIRQKRHHLNLLLLVGCAVERGGVCVFRRGADELRGVLADGLLHRGQRIL